LLKLSSGYILFVCIVNELLELCCGDISGLNRIDDMHGVSRRILLRHGGSDCSFWILFIRLLFYWFCIILRVMFHRKFFCTFFIKLHKYTFSVI